MSVLLQVQNLSKNYQIGGSLLSRKREYVRAIDNVSFQIEGGENFALVGESGCGKTTIARLILRLLWPTSGSVKFCGQNIYQLTHKQFNSLRRNIQLVFQDPFSSLNPRHTMRQVLSRPLILNRKMAKSELEDHILKLLEMVELKPPEIYLDRYPHELSGGQRQRLVIARAIASEPKLVVADEPVSALDVSIRAQILKLLRNLQQTLGMTYLFIAHDLAVVRAVSKVVAVMYQGKIVEITSTQKLFSNPLHPYTQMLLSAMPILDPEASRTAKRIMAKGEVSTLFIPDKGCRFRNRCPYAKNICDDVDPQLKEVEQRHQVACHL